MSYPGYYLPSDYDTMLFKYADDTLFTGTMRVQPVRIPYNGVTYPEKEYTIENGYLVGTVNSAYSTRLAREEHRYDITFLDSDGSLSSITATKAYCAAYPDIADPCIIPLAYHTVDMIINISPQSPHDLSLFVDDVSVSTGTQQLTFTGGARVIDVRMFGVKLYQKAVVSPGTFVLNLSMTAKTKQLDLSGFEIVEGEITNNSGRTIPEVAVKSI